MGNYIYTIVWHFAGTLDTELDPRIFFDLEKAIAFARKNNDDEQHATIYKNVKDMECGYYRAITNVKY